jgi:hypothetical protein
VRHRLVIAVLIALFIASGGAQAVEEDQNLALAGVAEMFLHDPDEPTFGKEYLPVERLDFSLKSLHLIDDYLDSVSKLKGFGQKNELQVILRAGAYVGEVIRRNSTTARWRWLDYEMAKAINAATFERFGKLPATAAVLYNGKTFIFPLAKVTKRLTNGPEDSVHFFGATILSAKK